jgi:hypothetical protein
VRDGCPKHLREKQSQRHAVVFLDALNVVVGDDKPQRQRVLVFKFYALPLSVRQLYALFKLFVFVLLHFELHALKLAVRQRHALLQLYPVPFAERQRDALLKLHAIPLAVRERHA